ncbi:MAG: hypothetical protein AB1781_03020 [Pseudomonadota bacterium]
MAALIWVFRNDTRVEIKQVNIVLSSDGHSAVAIRVDNSNWVYIDPMFGYAFVDPETGKLLWIDEVITRLQSGQSWKDITILLPGKEIYNEELFHVSSPL